MNHPKPWLRYIEADQVDDKTLDIDGMKVRNNAGDKLGEVDGLIVDADSGRTYYIAVDAGGWFKSRQFLLPIGEAHLDADRDALVVALSKDQVSRFPGFDKDEFDTLTEVDIKRINDETSRLFDAGFTPYADEPYTAAWKRASYRYPDWWTDAPLLSQREDAPAHKKDAGSAPASSVSYARRGLTQKGQRAAVNDTSPHFDGRAQPGDVLGVETGGERTYVGDTKEDEDQRRQRAEDADPRNRENDR